MSTDTRTAEGATPTGGLVSGAHSTAGANIPPRDGRVAPTAATLKRAQHGDPWALAELLGSVRPRIVALAVRLVRDPDEAEDVVQDALTKVWKNLHRYEARSAFSTWLHRIVVNTALDHLRAGRNGVVVTRARVRDSQSEAVDAEAEQPQKVDETTPEELMARAEVGHLVRGAMDHLSPAHREILIWRELEGESYQDIARLARCPVGTVMSRLHHARHKLAETLGANAAELLPQAA